MWFTSGAVVGASLAVAACARAMCLLVLWTVSAHNGHPSHVARNIPGQHHARSDTATWTLRSDVRQHDGTPAAVVATQCTCDSRRRWLKPTLWACARVLNTPSISNYSHKRVTLRMRSPPPLMFDMHRPHNAPRLDRSKVNQNWRILRKDCIPHAYEPITPAACMCLLESELVFCLGSWELGSVLVKSFTARTRDRTGVKNASSGTNNQDTHALTANSWRFFLHGCCAPSRIDTIPWSQTPSIPHST
jgi:hypothetical protein